MGRLGDLIAKFWRVSSTRPPFRPTPIVYLCFPAQLLASALGELGVQAAPEQQLQGAQQKADTRSHLAAVLATRRGRVGILRSRGCQRRSAVPGTPRMLQLCAARAQRGKGLGGAPVLRLRTPSGPSSCFAGSRPEVVQTRQCLLAGRRRETWKAREEKREEGRGPGTPAPPTPLSLWKAPPSRSLFLPLHSLARCPPKPCPPVLSPATSSWSGTLRGWRGKKGLLETVAT